jgi:hypothetical protein
MSGRLLSRLSSTAHSASNEAAFPSFGNGPSAARAGLVASSGMGPFRVKPNPSGRATAQSSQTSALPARLAVVLPPRVGSCMSCVTDGACWARVWGGGEAA